MSDGKRFRVLAAGMKTVTGYVFPFSFRPLAETGRPLFDSEH